jgi:hypothetical protein
MIGNIIVAALLWIVIGITLEYYLACKAPYRNEYLDRTNNVVDIFVMHGVNNRVAIIFMMFMAIMLWPFVLTMVVLEMLGRGRSDRDDY